MKSIYDLTIENLEEFLFQNNYKKYNAIQIFEWLYDKRITSFDYMTNISNELKNLLKSNFSFERLVLEKEEIDKEVSKYLFKLNDGNKIETVLMEHNYGLSLCISSQIGCNIACAFCESGRLKKIRNLETSEFILQIMEVEKLIKKRISHIVVMGIGEPFDNYENLVDFIKIANHHKGLNIGARHITVSTCGIIPKIDEFSKLPFQVNLAISLHTANDKLRQKLMPIAKIYPLRELIKSVKNYVDKTNRRVTFEYILLNGINDSENDAKELCYLLKGINCYVNLIPYNESSNIEYARSKKEQIMKFYDIIKKEGISVTIRREYGSNISAACGQLRSQKEE